MASEVSIINQGLIKLGADPITSRADSSREAVFANAIFDEVRDALLRSHPWNFATARVKLARSARTPVSGFEYQYPLPSDFLALVNVADNDADTPGVDYKLGTDATDGSVVLSDATELWLRYIAKITDPNLFSEDFARVLSMQLAADLAVKLTGSRALMGDMEAKAEGLWTRATSRDSIDDMPDRRPEGSWVGARRGYRRDEYWPR